MPEVFGETPEVGYSYTDELPVSIRRVGGAFEEDRTKLAFISRRKYTWKLRRSECVGWLRSEVDDFLVRARDLQHEAFYLLDPADHHRTGVSLGDGTGAQVVFSFPTTTEEQRDWPFDSNVQVYVDGAPVSHTSVDTDARTVTLPSAPGNSLAVVIDYDYYRLCRVDGTFMWNSASGGVFDTSVNLVEVLG